MFVFLFLFLISGSQPGQEKKKRNERHKENKKKGPKNQIRYEGKNIYIKSPNLENRFQQVAKFRE